MRERGETPRESPGNTAGRRPEPTDARDLRGRRYHSVSEPQRYCSCSGVGRCPALPAGWQHSPHPHPAPPPPVVTTKKVSQPWVGRPALVVKAYPGRAGEARRAYRVSKGWLQACEVLFEEKGRPQSKAVVTGRKRSSSVSSEGRTREGSLDSVTGRLLVPKAGADSEVGGVQSAEGREGRKQRQASVDVCLGSLAEEGGRERWVVGRNHGRKSKEHEALCWKTPILVLTTSTFPPRLCSVGAAGKVSGSTRRAGRTGQQAPLNPRASDRQSLANKSQRGGGIFLRLPGELPPRLL